MSYKHGPVLETSLYDKGVWSELLSGNLKHFKQQQVFIVQLWLMAVCPQKRCWARVIIAGRGSIQKLLIWLRSAWRSLWLANCSLVICLICSQRSGRYDVVYGCFVCHVCHKSTCCAVFATRRLSVLCDTYSVQADRPSVRHPGELSSCESVESSVVSKR